jgi:putative ABC transport system substrate-binding protein
MRRRELMLLVGGAMTIAGALRAQQRAMRVIGILGSTSPGPYAPFVAAFREGLSETGYTEGRNLTIEYRWADGRYEQLPGLVADLIALNVQVILASGGIPSALAAKRATSTISIVFASGGDPVQAGLVDGLSRPGGNVTGVTFISMELTPKRLELLSELVPQAGGIVLLVNPSNAIAAERSTRDAQQAAGMKGVQLHILNAATEDEIETAFATLARLHPSGLLVGTDPFFFSRRELLVALAARYAVPAIYELREFVVAGGLASYGASIAAGYRQAGIYTGRILNGAKPADIPVEQPTKFELAVNLKTAKALGLTIPPSILARADEVIE